MFPTRKNARKDTVFSFALRREQCFDNFSTDGRFRKITALAIREKLEGIFRGIFPSRSLFITSGRERGRSKNFVPAPPFLLLVEWVNELR